MATRPSRRDELERRLAVHRRRRADLEMTEITGGASFLAAAIASAVLQARLRLGR